MEDKRRRHRSDRTGIEGRTDAPSVCKKKEKTDAVHRQFELDLQKHAEDNLQVLEIELADYRHRLKRIQGIMKGKTKVTLKESSRIEAFNQAMAVLRDMEEKIERSRQERINELDASSLTADQFQLVMEEIGNDTNRRLNTVKEEMRRLSEYYAS